MGIDIYVRWEGQSEAEKQAQYTGYSVEHGHVGYLREAYHGGPYATQVLVKEAFDDSDSDGGTRIPASTLRRRLPAALKAARERGWKNYRERYEDDHPVLQSFVKFVELVERLEKDKKRPRIIASY